MTSTARSWRILAASLPMLCLGLFGAATTSADPGPTEAPGQGPAVASAPVQSEPAAPATVACRRFAAVLQMSSVHYNDFAYAIAGNGAHVDYQDPAVRSENIDGRTALRKAAGEAMSTAATPGLTPAIANPMRSWSWHAAKLSMAMGLRADGDTLNNAATELNTAAEGTQLACADAGVKALEARHR